MNRRQFVKTTLALATAVASGNVFAAAAKKPNIIVIMADDLGWGDLCCYGHPTIKTPNLDRLAKEGTLFTQFYCNAAICSPTRAAMMTGKFPGRVRIHAQISTKQHMDSIDSDSYLNPKYTMMPMLLKKDGYHTMHIGKWHLSEWLHKNPNLPRPDRYGFEDYLLPYLNWPETKYGNKWAQKTHRARSMELFVDESIKYIQEKTDSEKPFFLQLWLLDPHVPLIPENDQLRHYDDIRSRQPYDTSPDQDPAKIYYNVVTEMDKQLGRLFKAVDKLGIAKDTYIIFTSDNGAANPRSYDYYVGVGSNGPFRGQKGSLYEGGIRAPFIIRKTGSVPRGKVDDYSVISGVDFLPTFCSIGGIKPPSSDTFDGEDVSGAFRGTYHTRKNPLMWQWRFGQPREALHNSPMLAIREGRWKLLANPDKSRMELYDLPSDPMEVDNRARSNPQVVEKLYKKLMDFHNSLPPGVYDKNVGSNRYPWPK